jgi:hypothetical protein
MVDRFSKAATKIRQWTLFLVSAVCYYSSKPNSLTPRSPVVTLCTARFNIQQCYVLPTQCIYVFCVDLRTNSDYFPIQH